MAIGGLWHGASWNFLIWGLIHGIGLAIVRWIQVLRKNTRPSAHPAARIARVVITFHFVLFAWTSFRAPFLSTARDILMQISSFTVSFATVGPPFALVLTVAVLAHYVPDHWYSRSLEFYSANPYYVQAAAVALLVIAIQYVAATGAVPFIYTRF